MANKGTKPIRGNASSANLGFEVQLWAAANALRGSMDAAEYKHVVLGLIFLKYISDAFEAHRIKLEAERDQGADPEDPDEYRAENIFWVPPEARWEHLKKNARQPHIGELVDNAMAAIERDNPSLKGVLPKDYARPALDKQRLGQLIDLVSNIHLAGGDNHARDILGRVYEYFLGQFASAEGKKGGEFYTPRCVVKLLVEMLEPFYTTWRLAKMNLAIRGIDGRIEQGDSFLNDCFPDLKADYILANPPFNMKNWGGEHLREDKRWKFGVPPAGNANFAWVQHMIRHLVPTGLAGFVLEGGSMSSGQSGEGEIRKNIIEADLVDCMVALPDKLFYSTQIPACLWFLARDKRSLPSPRGRGAGGEDRDRRGQVLFIDARKMGQMVDRTHRELTDEDIRKIADTYHAWRLPAPSGARQAGGDKDAGEYRDVPGFCKSATAGGAPLRAPSNAYARRSKAIRSAAGPCPTTPATRSPRSHGPRLSERLRNATPGRVRHVAPVRGIRETSFLGSAR